MKHIKSFTTEARDVAQQYSMPSSRLNPLHNTHTHTHTHTHRHTHI
jgi:hypothetical protein